MGSWPVMWGRAQNHSPAFLVWSLFVYLCNSPWKAIKVPFPNRMASVDLSCLYQVLQGRPRMSRQSNDVFKWPLGQGGTELRLISIGLTYTHGCAGGFRVGVVRPDLFQKAWWYHWGFRNTGGQKWTVLTSVAFTALVKVIALDTRL